MPRYTYENYIVCPNCSRIKKSLRFTFNAPFLLPDNPRLKVKGREILEKKLSINFIFFDIPKYRCPICHHRLVPSYAK